MAEEPSQIREEIEHTRAEIAETVQALGAKVDVKARVQDNLTEKTEQLQRTAHEVGHKIQEATPPQARTIVQRISDNPLPYAVFIVTFLVSMLLGRRSGNHSE